MTRQFTFRAGPEDSGLRLDDWLIRRLRAALAGEGRADLAERVSKTRVRALLEAGAVRFPGQTVRSGGRPLLAGQAVRVEFDPLELLPRPVAGDIAFTMTSGRVLYRDDWLLAVDKPAGLPSEPGHVASRDNLRDAVGRWLAAENPGFYLASHHRLDRDTSGVILYTINPEANAGIHRAFAEHLARKTYRALTVAGPYAPPPVFTVENRLGRISPPSAPARYGEIPDGDPARTDFRLLASGRLAREFEARPLTGRSHQIRVHLAQAGFPLLGDTLYGGSAVCAGAIIKRVMLHALVLELPHPITGETLTIEAPLPDDYVACRASLGLARQD